MATLSTPKLLRERVLSFLKSQAADGFQEAVDVQVGLFGQALLISSVFSLSMIALALHGAAGDDPECAAIVSREADLLAKLADEAGWRYFNLFADIPPDTDDLAQAIALLVAARHPERDGLLKGPLERLERNRVVPGRFRTWLVGSEAEAAAADAQWVAGRDPVHVEVVANVLNAVAGYDPARFRADLVAGADWLVAHQRAGLWESYWYYGHGYGTHLVLRLLSALERLRPELGERFAPAREAALDAILASQGPDGGWEARCAPTGLTEHGIEWRPTGSGALETALMLSALGTLGWPEGAAPAVERALGFLADRQDPDGGFAAEPYFFTLGMAPHQSRCLTSAAVLSSVSFSNHAHG
ncbi:MAG TPA: prenyltransferase/squalene oxidase repeat-containing protein [Stenomitos sp.]